MRDHTGEFKKSYFLDHVELRTGLKLDKEIGEEELMQKMAEIVEQVYPNPIE